ncbi:MAG: APC family permease [Acidobacteriia bacterium]|nr:APC family permease [Terriglobia bacterium]
MTHAVRARPSAPRKITLVPLVAATYFMVSGGPFGLEDIVSRSGYAGAIAILLVTPLVWSLPSALMVSELASAVPAQGGYYVWVSRALGPFWGFQEAWLSLVGSIFDMAIYPTLFVGYLEHFAPAMTAGGRGLWIGVALIAAAAAWNMLGAKTVGGSSVAIGVVLLAPFLVLTVYAFFHRSAPGGHTVPLRNVDFLGGILVSMWNYMGWDNASTVADEVDRPQRTYPRAMAATVLLVALTYALPIGAVALTGFDANRWSTGGWADVSRAILPHGAAGEGLAAAITIVGMVSAWGSLNALTMSYSRLPAVLADDGFLPRIFARRHPRTGAPWAAIIACAIAWALCLNLTFVKLIVLDVLLTGLSILLEFAALAALRIREPAIERPYRVPGGLAGAIGIAVLPVALLVLTVVRNDVEPVGPINALQLGFILIAAGVVAYFVGGWFRQHDHR